ncbi:hypothetical protein M407DRAFT_169064 [Tulasnella calospora MUT 4182]|uniref:Uncharacterized protein n=1 Tax=Tulasnella calospora MUT 4182 TaxID=1051891 RepID=A0A0C3K8C7_9AGAM|nr:hypothetical protein M407DRAFT_169064 [Tulasnella calospora MUT 4182]
MHFRGQQVKKYVLEERPARDWPAPRAQLRGTGGFSVNFPLVGCSEKNMRAWAAGGRVQRPTGACQPQTQVLLRSTGDEAA